MNNLRNTHEHTSMRAVRVDKVANLSSRCIRSGAPQFIFFTPVMAHNAINVFSPTQCVPHKGGPGFIRNEKQSVKVGIEVDSTYKLTTQDHGR